MLSAKILMQLIQKNWNNGKGFEPLRDETKNE